MSFFSISADLLVYAQQQSLSGRTVRINDKRSEIRIIKKRTVNIRRIERVVNDVCARTARKDAYYNMPLYGRCTCCVSFGVF